MNKRELAQKIKKIDGLTLEEKAALISLVNNNKKYGLVWEEKPEEVEEELLHKLPVLKEVKERFIEAKPLPKAEEAENLFSQKKTKKEQPALPDSFPNHILIEGDNLHALTALTFTHENKIDVIYIEPPYNTGNKDFKYNDSFVDKEDGYRHSKWLSFMSKRLRIAKTLMKDSGVIFISIDDNEQAQLKMLCDEIFGEDNFLNNIIWQKKFSPQNDAKFFSDNHDFLLAYKKKDWKISLLDRSEIANNRYKNPDNDPRGLWISSDLTVKTYTKNYDYPITTPSGKIVNPTNGRCWFTSKERMEILIKENRVWFGENGTNTPRIKKFLSEVKQGVTPMTIWLHEEVGHNQSAKQEMNAILHDESLVFDTPKPTKLIDRVLRLSSKPDEPVTVLDFFAGSGTTLHATMLLNKEDGGLRKCILVTNNENEIADRVCYERNKRVITGFTDGKGEFVPGITNNNFRYYQTDFVPREPSLKNKKQLTRLATELLCIKHDCYKETLTGTQNLIRLFQKSNFNLLVIYDDIAIPEGIEMIKGFPKGSVSKVYVFSEGSDPYTEDFREVEDKASLCALPDAIYKAYQNILPKKKRIDTEQIPVEKPEGS